ncbi:MAG TPA: hypothetical protein VIL46_10055, partial [Gemmataceae bacterium]
MAELLRAETPGEALALLERHAQRRRAGLPTLSVLAGPAGLGARLWRAWAERVRRPVVQTGDPSAGAVAAAVAAAAARRRDLAADALRFVAGRAGEPRLAARAEWEHLTQHEFALRWQNLSLDPGHDPAAALCHRLTRALAAGEPVSATTVTSGPNPVAALAALLPPEALPALILVPAPASADPAAWLRRAAEVLGELAAAVPALPAAVAAEADAVSRYLAAEPESRAKALVREGAVAVPHLSEAAVRDQIRETGAADDVPEATVRRLAEG